MLTATKQDGSEHSGGDAAAARSRLVGFLVAHLSLVTVAVVALIGVARVVSAFGVPYGSCCDSAVSELMVRRAARFEQLLGPYSRFGWSHPGPFWFYLLAPFARAFGARGMFLGAWVVNMAAVTVSVWVMRRRCGEWVARWTVAVLCVLMLTAPASDLWRAWNPSALALPIVAMAVLTAAVWQGSRLSFAGVVLVASFLAQTHIAMVPLTTASVVVAAVGVLVDARRRRSHGSTDARTPASGGTPQAATRVRLLWVLAVAAIVLVWVPPVYEQAASGGEGNVSRLVDFAQDSSAGSDDAAARPSVGRAAVATAFHTSTFPLGRDPWEGYSYNPQPLGVARLLVATGWAALAALVLVAGRRRSGMAVALAAWSVTASAVGFLAVLGIVGGEYSYLLWWMAALPVPVAIGAGALAATVVAARFRRADTSEGSGPVRPGLARGGAVALLAVPVLLTIASVAVAPRHGSPSEPSTAEAARLTVDRFGSTLDAGVLVVPTSADDPLAAGLVNELDRLGVRVGVPDGALYKYGADSAATNRERLAVAVVFADEDPSPLLGPTARPVDEVGGDGLVLWVADR